MCSSESLHVILRGKEIGNLYCSRQVQFMNIMIMYVQKIK